MTTLKKKELEKIWKQLDNCCEALEKLEYAGIETRIDSSLIVSLKNKVEEIIRQKARKEIDLK